MLSIDKHCDILAQFVRDKSTQINDGFKLFVQLFSGIVGGAVAVRLQYSGNIPEQLIILSNLLVSLVAATSIIIIMTAFYSWYGFRVRMSEIAGKDRTGKFRMLPPKLLWSAKAEIIMLTVIVIASGSFVFFNPLQFPK